MDPFSKHLRYSGHFPSEQYAHDYRSQYNQKYNKKDSKMVCQFCKEKWSELIHVPKCYAFNAGFFLWVSALSWRIIFAVLCSAYRRVLLTLQIKEVQRRRKKNPQHLHVMIYCQNGSGGEQGFTPVYE